MKMYMKIFVLLALFTAVACGDTSSGNAQSDNSDTVEKSTDSEQQKSYKAVADAYLSLKDAFVESDAGKASSNAKVLENSISESDIPNAEKISNSASKIAEGSDIEKQRENFEELSMAFYDLAKKENLNITLYKQYCPMAFDNKGAFWLSSEKEIRNPYFGDRMLKCGKVQEEL